MSVRARPVTPPSLNKMPTYPKSTKYDADLLFWLAARDIVFFTTCEPELEGWSGGWSAAVSCNDTFAYACADAEFLAPGREAELKALFDKYGWSGVVAWCAKERNQYPIKEYRSEQYRKALEELGVPHLFDQETLLVKYPTPHKKMTMWDTFIEAILNMFRRDGDER